MITNKLNRFYFLLIFGVLLSCNNNLDYPIEPIIEFISFDKNSINQSNINQDSIFITIKFTDGDGDLGSEPNDSTLNVFIIDNRTGFDYGNFKLPAIPKEGANNGVTGTVQMKLFSTCCIFPDLTPPCSSPLDFPTNTISFDIYIEDRAKNKSNTITTPELILNCN